jgi:hypothetical protein
MTHYEDNEECVLHLVKPSIYVPIFKITTTYSKIGAKLSVIKLILYG